MTKAFEKFTDDELYNFLAVNCPEGQLLEACDELVDRFEFYKMVLTELCNASGIDLDELLADFGADEPKAAEDMTREELIEEVNRLRGEQ